jgi:two-component system response regulator RegX3
VDRYGGPRTHHGDVRRPILVIEDEPLIAQSVSRAVAREGFLTVVATEGAAGIDCCRAENPALVMLDLTLANMSGLDVCRVLRSESDIPIMIVTAKDSEADKVAALEMGADDYITKPFSTKELVARMRAHLRRTGLPVHVTEESVLYSGPIELDAARHEVYVRGEQVSFTPKEFDLLETFMRGESRLRTRDYLIDRVWGAKYFGDTKTLDVHVKRLRTKIERDPHHPEHLVTVRGLGYRFIAEPWNARHVAWGGRPRLQELPASSAV